MTKTLILRDEVIQYPDEGDANYGESATFWAEEVTDILGNVSGPGDIATTEVTLTGTNDGTFTTGAITGLSFDTAYVQSVVIEGFVTRTFNDGITNTQVESFEVLGAYNGTELNISSEFSGDDTELEFTVTGGQIGYKYLNVDNTDSVTVKFKASAIVNSDFFA